MRGKLPSLSTVSEVFFDSTFKGRASDNFVLGGLLQVRLV